MHTLIGSSTGESLRVECSSFFISPPFIVPINRQKCRHSPSPCLLIQFLNSSLGAHSTGSESLVHSPLFNESQFHYSVVVLHELWQNFWYCAALSHQLGQNEPLEVALLGRKVRRGTNLCSLTRSCTGAQGEARDARGQSEARGKPK